MKIEDFESWQERHWARHSTPFHNSLFYLAACAHGEAGEAFKVVKAAAKHLGTNEPNMSHAERGQLVDEIGDTVHYCLRLLNRLGVTSGEMFARNQAKLVERYGD